ncbi:PepSY-associated TM helix domain-containing protein [Paenibacillus solisilvae]|uniref:PepSY-associated TM helix domain-containing protein n=1 Tax=Paenibacillus solisilvae TaxID=2486751 RepID=A0ABW0W682_9BACL
MMKKTRKLHLWIGLISSVFILIQSVTGLLLSEPWLAGGSSRGEMPRMEMSGSFNGAAANNGASSSGDTSGGLIADSAGNTDGGNQQAQTGTTPGGGSTPSNSDQSVSDSGTADQRQQMQQRPIGQGFPGGGEQGEGGIVGFAKKLHEGMIYGNSFKIVVDLTAVSLIFMTLTGIYLSIRVLKGQSQSKQRRRSNNTSLIES